jgi:phytoene/squalene synthetase
MCLKVFTHKENNYDELNPPARKLGEAFQKVNFLRDIRADLEDRDRFYFPDVNFDRFDNASKNIIEERSSWSGKIYSCSSLRRYPPWGGLL